MDYYRIRQMTGRASDSKLPNHQLHTHAGMLFHVVISPRGYTTSYVSPKVEQILGYHPGAILSVDNWWSDKIHPDDFQRVASEARRAIETGSPELNLTCRIRHADGSYRLFHAAGHVEWHMTGGPVSVHGYCMPSTECERTQQESGNNGIDEDEDLFENAAVALHWVGPDGRILRANKVELAMLGYEAHEYVGRNIAEFHIDGPVIQDILNRLCSKETLQDYEARLRCKDGSIKHVLISSNVLWRNGEFIHTRCFTQDISARRAMEEALRESDERFRQITENTTDILWLWSPEGSRTLYANKAFETTWGRSVREVQENPWTWANAIHPDDRDRVVAAFKATAATGGYKEEYRIVRPDGSVRWVQDRAFPVRNERGEVYRVTGIAQDITERKDIERALSESEERFRQIAENTKDVLWMNSPAMDGILYVNRAYEEIWGRSIQELYADPWNWAGSVYHEDRERVIAAAKSTAATGAYKEEYRVVRPDGSIRWVQDRAFTIRNEQGEVYRVGGIVQDITERKMLERELIEASNREQRRLGRDLHDDLGQWLTAIHLEARALVMKLRPDCESAAAQAEKVASYAREALERTRMLARGMTPAVIESGGLAAALRDLADTTARIFHTRCICNCSDAVIVRDPEAALHLFRIAQEAISNAIRHGQATEVQISLESEEGAHAMLSIRDNGQGICTPLPKTLGLGLRIMEYRAGLMGASLDIYPAEGVGTEVVCRFSREL